MNETDATDTSSDEQIRLRELLAVARGQRGSIAIAIALLLASALLTLTQPLLAGRVIDDVKVGSTIAPTLIVLALVFVLDALAQAFGQFVLLRLGEAVVKDLRTQMCARLVRIRIPTLTEYRLGDLLSRVSTDTVALRSAISRSLVHLLTGTVTVVGAIVLMIVVSPWLFLIVLSTFLIAGTALALVTSRIQQASQLAQEHTGRLTADLERTLSAPRTVKMSRTEDREIAQLDEAAADVYQQGVRSARLIATVTPVINLALTGSFLLVLLLGGIWVANGTVSMGALTTMLLLALYIVVPVGDIFEAITEIKMGMGALQRIKQTLALDIEEADGSRAPHTPNPRSRPDHTCASTSPDQTAAVQFDDVTFRYRNDTPVLQGVSATFPSRSYTALVGRSGAGKSTMFALTCGFYRPTSGRILIRGTDIESMSLQQLRSAIALMEQDAPMMHGTLRDNLTYACPDATEHQIADIIERAGISQLIQRSPAGLDTVVGDHGLTLSGGERQRVAFGRALLTQPEVVLLDEPTAMLDTATESVLAREIRVLSQQATVIVIAHRLSTIEAADRVIMLDQGTVAAVGQHRTLLDESAKYRELLGQLDTRTTDIVKL